MDNFINNIKVTNFKSLKDCEIKNCKRINLFIGRPNVGKSNILEALSIFTLPEGLNDKSLKFTDFVRVESEIELFYNGDPELPAEVDLGDEYSIIRYDPKIGLLISNKDYDRYSDFNIANTFQISGSSSPKESPVKKYIFKSDVVYRNSHSKYLNPPYGSNLFTIIGNYKEIKSEVSSIFSESKLEVAMDRGSGTLKVIQKDKSGIIFLVPYSSIADTIQRIIFYKTAIESNENSVLLFEEPEAHSFPPFITKITQDIIAKKDNQFFITTHSPVVLNDFLENAKDELAVYIVKYEDHQTKVRALSKEELEEVSEFGVDLFTNSETYI